MCTTTVSIVLLLSGVCVAATDIAVYYFPGYHPDPRTDSWHGKGWTEWELLKVARPRFEGHQQPKVPLWGCQDESKPEVMADKIAAAADHGVDVFLFDWYWYENQPFLQGALERGFLKARNNDRLRFAVMWANHDWQDIQPTPRMGSCRTLHCGDAPRPVFEAATNHVIRNYFPHPSYWRVDGGLYFSIYELATFIKGLGSVADARAALDDFRARVEKAGLGKLHLNAVVWDDPILPGDKTATDVNKVLDALGFDSITSYVWIHNNPMPDFPMTSYAAFAQRSARDYDPFTDKYKLPYFPNVTMGWDSSPRTVQSDVYDNVGYPFTPVLKGNTPDEFAKALGRAKTFLDRGLTRPRVLTINAWNEWTEGSYLEPDTTNGLKYLEAIRTVFKGE